MKIERLAWDSWDALRCEANGGELVVGVSAGPRILSLRRSAGPNLLYRDTKDFRVGDWRLHGGHRFTVAPEGQATYDPDNAPCSVEWHPSAVRVSAPPGRDGTRRLLHIRAAGDGAGVDRGQILRNEGTHPWRGALWGIACVPPGGVVVAPRTHPQLRFWPGADPAGWEIEPRHIVLRPTGCRSKAGWHSSAGWVASLQSAAALVIQALDPPPLAQCVDDGCNVEVFTCPDYTELETLSGWVTLAPGACAAHRQRWRLLAPVFAPEDWADIGAQAGCNSGLE